MKYEKPEIAEVGSALVAVKGSGKQSSLQTDSFAPTVPAYEADE